MRFASALLYGSASFLAGCQDHASRTLANVTSLRRSDERWLAKSPDLARGLHQRNAMAPRPQIERLSRVAGRAVARVVSMNDDIRSVPIMRTRSCIRRP